MNTNNSNVTVKKKNYHKTENVIIVVVLAAIAVLVPLWFLFLKPEPTPVGPATPKPDYSVYDHAIYKDTDTVVGEVAMDKIESIHLIKKDSSWGFVYDYVHENYFLDGYGMRITYDKDYAFTFIRGFASMGTAQRLVAEGVTDFKKYGLTADNEDLLTVRVKTMDGKQVDVLIGDEMADKTGYYATTEGNDKVYTVSPINYGYLSCAVYDVMDTRITNPFTESVYVPEFFSLSCGNEAEGESPTLLVRLEYIGDAAAESEHIKTTIVTYPTIYLASGASSHYNSMIYDKVRGPIYGERVVDAEKENESFTPEYLKETYGIDVHDKNCKLLRYYRDIEGMRIENEVWFSPKSNDGYYFAYNPGLRTVVKIAASTVEFIEWEPERYMEASVYLQDINAVRELTINSTRLPQMYVDAGHKAVNLTFISNTPADENEELKVTYNGGKTIPDVLNADGSLARSGIDNYRHLYLALHSVDLYDKLSAEELEKNGVDVTKEADVTVTIETRKGEEHVLRFYYYGSGRAYFTYNGSLGYTVYQSALKNLLKSCEDLMQGKQIPKF